MELLSTMIAGINVGSALCSALAALTGTNAVRTAAIGTLGGAVCGAALFADQPAPPRIRAGLKPFLHLKGGVSVCSRFSLR